MASIFMAMTYLTRYIWVMPPENKEQDYVFYYRPDDMYIPNSQQLERWCGVARPQKRGHSSRTVSSRLHPN